MAGEEIAAGSSGKLVIKNVGLMLSGDLAAPIVDADALVAIGGRISAVGRAGDLDFSGAATTIDANGVALAPGLIDSHVHPVGRRGRASSAGSIPACTAASPR
jgi:enamidase